MTWPGQAQPCLGGPQGAGHSRRRAPWSWPLRDRPKRLSAVRGFTGQPLSFAHLITLLPSGRVRPQGAGSQAPRPLPVSLPPRGPGSGRQKRRRGPPGAGCPLGVPGWRGAPSHLICSHVPGPAPARVHSRVRPGAVGWPVSTPTHRPAALKGEGAALRSREEFERGPAPWSPQGPGC